MFIVLSSWQAITIAHSVHENSTAPGGSRPLDQAIRLEPQTLSTVVVYYYHSARKLILILRSRGG